MKKIMILAALTILMPAGVGCTCGPIRGWLCRGYDAKCNNQCVETCSPCGGTCNSGPTFGEVVPGATYIPGPIAN